MVDESDKLFEEGKTGFRDQVNHTFIISYTEGGLKVAGEIARRHQRAD